MSVARIVPIIINSGRVYTNPLANNADQNGTNVISYKFFVPRNVGIVTIRISVEIPCPSCPAVEFYVQANALPSQGEQHNLYAGVVYPNQTGETIFDDIVVQSSQWHFIDIKFQEEERESRATSKDPKTIQLVLNPNSGDERSGDNRTLQEVDISVQVDFHSEDEEAAAATDAVDPKKPLMFRGIEYHPLLRQTYREFFMFDYDLLPDVNGSVPTHLNITAGTPIGFRFEVGDVYDIGGTLSFAVAIKPEIKDIGDTDSATNERANNNGQADGQDEEERLKGNQTIVVCMHLGEPGEPIWPDSCRYGKRTLPASSVVNNSDVDTSTGLIHVPFPESGKWYITMGLFCHGAATTARVTIIDSVKDFIRKYTQLLDTMRTPCSCALRSAYYKSCIEDRKCLAQMNETETLKIKECLMDSKCTSNYEDMTKKFEIHHRFATEQSVATDDSCNSSVVFTISSSPCVAGRCGRYGRCYHYMSGGFVFSTCLCIKGYRGWDCTEDSQVPTSISILIASLLLTLSNLLFIPSIYFAIRRKYYTEAVIYFCAMFFSIFYHACDSGEDEYSFCLVKIGVLQFCDFYCGLLAIWVTLIAMSHIRQQFVSLLHMLGAIVLAFGTELNKQSLWVFLAPALTGICLISVSWGMRCRKTRKWFPSKKYLTIFMPIGTVLVMTGLVCYAFLQTKQNYHIVHSIWHMVMALAILCLLPSRKTFLPKC